MDLETRAPDQLGRATSFTADALLIVQEPDAPAQSIEARHVVGQLHYVGVVTETRAQLYADLAHPANTRALVTADPDQAKSGYYQKSGISGAGAWALIGVDELALREQLGEEPGADMIGSAGGGVAAELKRARPALPQMIEHYHPGEDFDAGDVDHVMDALAEMVAAVNAAGGGLIEMRPGATYLVGRQEQEGSVDSGGAPGDYAWAPEALIRIEDATKPIVIRGNGARIRNVGGKYGAFDPDTQEPIFPEVSVEEPYLEEGARGSPYTAMIELVNCTGGYTIENLELDGNCGALELGGDWGDVGRQIHASGIWDEDCSGPFSITNVRSHHHALDGVLLRRTGLPGGGTVSGLICDHNGRQGVSLCGGHDIKFVGCYLGYTGRGIAYDEGEELWPLSSAPAAGLDIEADGDRSVRNIVFEASLIECNNGYGMTAFQGDSADVTFKRCTIIGDAAPSIGPKRPGFTFEECLLVGAVLDLHPATAEHEAVHFIRTKLTDDATLSPTGQVYGRGSGGIMIDLVTDKVVIFENFTIICTDADTNSIISPGSSPRFHNFTVVDAENCAPGGRHSGISRLTTVAATLDNVVLAPGSIMQVDTGSGFVRQFYGTKTWDPGAVTAAAPVTTTVTVPGLAVGDSVRACSSILLEGLELSAEATGANEATVRLKQPDSDAASKDLGSMTLTVKGEKAAA